ncbi:hypothetical protein BJX65DRAFT_85348 [Aspergillus insuetus]
MLRQASCAAQPKGNAAQPHAGTSAGVALRYPSRLAQEILFQEKGSMMRSGRLTRARQWQGLSAKIAIIIRIPPLVVSPRRIKREGWKLEPRGCSCPGTRELGPVRARPIARTGRSEGFMHAPSRQGRQTTGTGGRSSRQGLDRSSGCGCAIQELIREMRREKVLQVRVAGAELFIRFSIIGSTIGQVTYCHNAEARMINIWPGKKRISSVHCCQDQGRIFHGASPSSMTTPSRGRV